MRLWLQRWFPRFFPPRCSGGVRVIDMSDVFAALEPSKSQFVAWMEEDFMPRFNNEFPVTFVWDFPRPPSV